MRSRRCLLPFLVILLALLSCDDNDLVDPEGQAEETTNFAIRVDRTNDFSVDLFKRVRDQQGNLVLSPHSTSVAFAMLYAGARGLTEREIADVMKFHYPQENGFHSAMARLNDDICSRGDSWGDFRIWMANGCWIDRQYPVLQDYKDTLTTYYGAEIDTVDFMQHPEESRLLINDWVSGKTADQIKELFPPLSIDYSTVMVLANAFCFEARWLECFDPDMTYDRTFTLLGGTTIQVEMMNGEGHYGYFVGEGYEAIRLPYEGNEVSMLVMLPDEGNYQVFEDGLTGSQVVSLYDSIRSTWVGIGLPRFHISTALDLGEVFFDMGMTTAFGPGADFSGIDGVVDGIPWISCVLQKTEMYLNEYGTFIFSATGMVMTLGVHPSFYAVRPFIFAIVDEPTGVILFIGRVLVPNGYDGILIP